MKSYSYLVNKYLKVNRKRSMLTIIGIISSVILFFTIGYMANYLEDTKKIDGKKVLGDYDVVVFDVDKENAKKLNDNVKIDKCGFYSILTEIEIEFGGTKIDMPIYELDSVSINKIFNEKLHIKEGRTPKSNKEIMLDYTLKSQFNISIDDKIDVDRILYNVVGFYEDNKYSKRSVLNGFTYLDRNNLDKNVGVILKFKNKHNKIKDIKDVVEDSGIYYDGIYEDAKIAFNSFVISDNIIADVDRERYIEEETILIASLNISVLALTIVFTYGSINVSLNERKKEFAALRCIGATPSKIKKLLVKEGIILSLCSLIPGIIIAQIISWGIIYTFQSYLGDMTYSELNGKIYIDVIINTIIFMVINIFVATIIPIRKMKKLSPIEGLKNNNINNKVYKIRTSKLIRRLFGYSGEISYKNIRSNNKSFIITIITLNIILISTISINGFRVSTNSFYDENINKLTDITIGFNPIQDDTLDKISIDDINRKGEEFIKGVENLEVASEIYTSKSLIQSIALEDATLNEGIHGPIDIMNRGENNKHGIYSQAANLLVLDDKYIDRIIPNINSQGKRIDKLGSNDFIVLNMTSTNFRPSIKRVSPINEKVGKTMDLYFVDDYNNKNIKEMTPIKMKYLGSIESKDLIESDRFGYANKLTLIVSEDFYLKHKDLIKESHGVTINVLVDLDKNQNKDTALRKISDYVYLNKADYLEEKKSEIKYKTELEIYYAIGYIALALLILIGIINLINIKNMDIYLREKELKILLAIGIKKSKLNKMIFLEGIIAWFISSIIGTIVSIIILIAIKYLYIYQGYLQDISIPYYIVFVYNIILLLITMIINVVPYKRLKNIELNNLMKDRE